MSYIPLTTGTRGGCVGGVTSGDNVVNGTGVICPGPGFWVGPGEGVTCGFGVGTLTLQEGVLQQGSLGSCTRTQ